MRPLVGVLWLLASVLFVACGPAQVVAAPGTASAPPRTAVPTWTLPFVPGAPTPTPSAAPLPSPAASVTPAATATPRPTATATECAGTEGTVLALSVPSERLNYPIDLQLYLPPCYAVETQAYPVLYLIHGLGYTQDQWVRLGMPAAADRLIAAGEIAPLIIVMPRDRLDARLDPALVTDLVPYVDGHYRTLPEARYRAIGGLSRGAGWAVRLGLHYPEVFGRIGAHSPAVFYGDENAILQWTRAAAESSAPPALYVDIGQNDGQPQSAYWLDQIFKWFKLEHTYLVRPGSHTEKYWSAHVPEYLRFYAGDWRPGFGPTSTPLPPWD